MIQVVLVVRWGVQGDHTTVEVLHLRHLLDQGKNGRDGGDNEGTGGELGSANDVDLLWVREDQVDVDLAQVLREDLSESLHVLKDLGYTTQIGDIKVYLNVVGSPEFLTIVLAQALQIGDQVINTEVELVRLDPVVTLVCTHLANEAGHVAFDPSR